MTTNNARAAHLNDEANKIDSPNAPQATRRLALILRAIALGYESGNLTKLLQGIYTKDQVELILNSYGLPLSYFENYHRDMRMFRTMGLDTPAAFLDAKDLLNAIYKASRI